MASQDILPFDKRALPKTLVLFDVDGTLTPARLVWINYFPVE